MTKPRYTGTRTEKSTVFNDGSRVQVVVWDDRTFGDMDIAHVHVRVSTLRDGIEQITEGSAEHMGELKKILGSFGL